MAQFAAAALRARQPGHARAAVGDRRVRRRHRAPGGPHRHARRAQALGLVRPVAQRRGRPAQPRIGRQPRARRRARAHAGAPRLRRAGARRPGQRRERRALQRPGRQRAAGRRRGSRLPRAPARRRTRGGSPASACRWAARCCSRRPRAIGGWPPSSPTGRPGPWTPTRSCTRPGRARGRMAHDAVGPRDLRHEDIADRSWR